MDALEQLHAAQQRALSSVEREGWDEVGARLRELAALDERALWPALRDLAVRDHVLDDGRDRHRGWWELIDRPDTEAGRARLRDEVAEHVTWTGVTVLAVLCRSLSDDRFDRLGARMAALVVPRPAPRPELAEAS